MIGTGNLRRVPRGEESLDFEGHKYDREWLKRVKDVLRKDNNYYAHQNMLDLIEVTCRAYPQEPNLLSEIWGQLIALFISRYAKYFPDRCEEFLRKLEMASSENPNDNSLRSQLKQCYDDLKSAVPAKASPQDNSIEEAIKAVVARELGRPLNMIECFGDIDEISLNETGLGKLLFLINFFMRQITAKISDNFADFVSALSLSNNHVSYEGKGSTHCDDKNKEFLRDFWLYEFLHFDVNVYFPLVYKLFCRIIALLAKSEEIEGVLVPPNNISKDAALTAFFDLENVPKEERAALTTRFHIEIARATRPKWVGRLERGGELATLSAPLFLKRVHADYIAKDGTVENELIRAIDPDLMKAIEAYISARRTRANKKNIPFTLGDAEGLNFVLLRPGASSLAAGRNKPSA